MMNIDEKLASELKNIIFTCTKNDDEAKDIIDLINKPNTIQKIGNNILYITIPTWMFATTAVMDKGLIAFSIMAGGGLLILGEEKLLSLYNNNRLRKTLEDIKENLHEYKKDNKELKRKLSNN